MARLYVFQSISSVGRTPHSRYTSRSIGPRTESSPHGLNSYTLAMYQPRGLARPKSTTQYRTTCTQAFIASKPLRFEQGDHQIDHEHKRNRSPHHIHHSHWSSLEAIQR